MFVRPVIGGRLTPLPRHLRWTITFDNGTEFAEPAALEKAVGSSVYFAHPYYPWERGTNENTNGLSRQFFPQGAPFQEQSRYRIAPVERSLNHRPRQRLQSQTPSEIFSEYCQRTLLT